MTVMPSAPCLPLTGERRRPRAAFTRILARLCECLDAQPTRHVCWRWQTLQRVLECTVLIRTLWVAGSYARGAVSCGDLDVVVDCACDPPNAPPSPLTISRAFFHSPADMQLHRGTPADNTSGVPLEGAIAIWTGPRCDWRTAIASIAEDASAGRFARPLDALPFRTEQLQAELPELERLLQARSLGRIDWTYTSLDSVEVRDIREADRLPPHLASSLGARNRALLPVLSAWFQGRHPQFRDTFGIAPQRCAFRRGGSYVVLGRPWLPTSLLDDGSHDELVLLPHRCARGPNGIWCIRRGSAHPLAIAANQLGFHAVVQTSGEIEFETGLGPDDHDDLRVARLHDKVADARREARLLTRLTGEPFTTTPLTGEALLAVLARVDMVSFGDRDLALTGAGASALGQRQPMTVDTVLASIHGQPGNAPAF